MGMSGNTVARLFGIDEAPRYVREPTGSQLDPFAEAIAAMLDADPADIREHLRALVYRGGTCPARSGRSTGGIPGRRCWWAMVLSPAGRDREVCSGGKRSRDRSGLGRPYLLRFGPALTVVGSHFERRNRTSSKRIRPP